MKKRKVVKIILKGEKLKKNINLTDLYKYKIKNSDLSKNKAMFLEISDICHCFWCQKEAVLRAEKHEFMFFYQYFKDRLKLAYELGKISENKKFNLKELSNIGQNISLKEINKLLKKDNTPCRKVLFFNKDELDKSGPIIPTIASLKALKKHNKHDEMVIKNIDDFSLEKNIQKRLVKGYSFEENYQMAKGRLLDFLHKTKTSSIPSICWNFNWEDLIIIGEPDGIGEKNIYEFKTTANEFLYYYMKPKGLAQGQLYGYFFERNNIVLETYIEKKVN